MSVGTGVLLGFGLVLMIKGLRDKRHATYLLRECNGVLSDADLLRKSAQERYQDAEILMALYLEDVERAFRKGGPFAGFAGKAVC